MVVAVDAEDVSSLGDVLYKSLRGTVRSMIRWLLKCSNVSPPPTRASDLVKVLEQTNLTDVVVHPTDHTPFYVSMTIFMLISFVFFYLLMVTYSWASSMWSTLLRTTKASDDPALLPIVQPDQIGFEERPPKFKVKMTEPVHVHLVESTKKRSEAAAAKPRGGGGSLRGGDISARAKVESIVEIPMQNAPSMLLPLGSAMKAIPDRDSMALSSTQSSQSLTNSSAASGNTNDIPPSATASMVSDGGEKSPHAAKREAAGGGRAVNDQSINNRDGMDDYLSRSPTEAERKALSLIFGDSEDESEKTSGLAIRRRKPKDLTGILPLARSIPRSSLHSPVELSFREPSKYELSLGARYGAGAESTTPALSGSAPPSSKKYTPCSKISSTVAIDTLAASPEGIFHHPTIGILPLSTDCAVRAGCRECQLQPLHVIVLRWSDANSKTVFVTGSFVNWNSKIPMHRDRVGWVVELRLPRGHHEYRFIVDGKWELDRGRLGTIHAAQKGIINHIVHVN